MQDDAGQTASHLNVRSNNSSAHDEEHAALPALEDETSKLAKLPSAPCFLTAAAAAETNETLEEEEEDVCSDEIKDMWF